MNTYLEQQHPVKHNLLLSQAAMEDKNRKKNTLISQQLKLLLSNYVNPLSSNSTLNSATGNCIAIDMTPLLVTENKEGFRINEGGRVYTVRSSVSVYYH